MKKVSLLLALVFIVGIAFVVSGCDDKDTSSTTSGGGDGTGTVSGSLDIKGSDTLLQLVASMAEAFSEKNPDAEVSVTGGGSGTGIAALMNGEIDMANASRNVKEKETSQLPEGDQFYPFIVARDGLSIIVHPDTPLTQLTVDELGAIFRGETTDWSAVSDGSGDISLYGRQSTSGTYEFMQDEVLEGDYSSSMYNLEGNQAIVDAVKDDELGIGYVGIGYAVNAGDSVKIINIASETGGAYYEPTDDANIASGDYPITRPLYHFLLEVPESGSVTHEFLKFEQTEAGLDVVDGADFYPPNATDEEINQNLMDMIEG